MPRSPMRLLLLRAKVDRLLKQCEPRLPASRPRVQRLRQLRHNIADRLVQAGFPRPAL
jgi:hypothetical protein